MGKREKKGMRRESKRMRGRERREVEEKARE